MNWTLPGDSTLPLITAEDHIKSAHGSDSPLRLPRTCVLFEMGMALSYLEEQFETVTLSQRLPCFLDNPRCIALKGHPGLCLTKGGYGAPAAVDTLETLRALGVEQVVVAGLCGVFAREVQVGDLLVPEKVLCEEGCSHHYWSDLRFVLPDRTLSEQAAAFFSGDFSVFTAPTVTTDAVYRQTFAKEAYWREEGCAGVDMETSALLAVSRYYHMPAVSILLASDKHPITQEEPPWAWGSGSFQETRRRFVQKVVEFSLTLENPGE